MTTIRGLQRGRLVWQPDFTASRDNKGKWTGSVSFVCHAEDAVNLLPSKGASCPEVGFSFLGFDSCSVSNYEGGLKLVSCKYAAGGEGPEFGFEDESTNGRTEMAISVSEEPLLTHPRYAEVGEEDRLKLNELASGRYKALPAEEGEPTKYIQKVDGEGVKEITFDDELAAELASKITKGFTSYLVPQQIFRVSSVSNNEVSASVLNKVGKIASAPGAPSVGGGRNWLFMGCTSVEEGNAYSISYEWRLSGPGGWDEDIYGEGDE